MKRLTMTLGLLITSLACTKKDPKVGKEKPENKLSAVYDWPPTTVQKFTVLPESRRLAKNYYIILDGSGSMNDSECADGRKKYQVAMDALKVFAKNVPPSDNLGLLVFDDRGTDEKISLDINNRDSFYQELSKIRVGGGTPLGSAIDYGKRRLEDQARKQLGYGEYNLIVVTDGAANKGDSPERAVEQLVNNTPVIVQTIGFCIGANHSLNQPNRTIYKSANNPKELMNSLEEVLAESETFTDSQFEK